MHLAEESVNFVGVSDLSRRNHVIFPYQFMPRGWPAVGYLFRTEVVRTQFIFNQQEDLDVAQGFQFVRLLCHAPPSTSVLLVFRLYLFLFLCRRARFGAFARLRIVLSFLWEAFRSVLRSFRLWDGLLSWSFPKYCHAGPR